MGVNHYIFWAASSILLPLTKMGDAYSWGPLRKGVFTALWQAHLHLKVGTEALIHLDKSMKAGAQWVSDFQQALGLKYLWQTSAWRNDTVDIAGAGFNIHYVFHYLFRDFLNKAFLLRYGYIYEGPPKRSWKMHIVHRFQTCLHQNKLKKKVAVYMYFLFFLVRLLIWKAELWRQMKR